MKICLEIFKKIDDEKFALKSMWGTTVICFIKTNTRPCLKV